MGSNSGIERNWLVSVNGLRKQKKENIPYITNELHMKKYSSEPK